MRNLQLGCAKVDITPNYSIPLAGFAVRGNKPYEAVSSRIFLRVLLLQQTDADGASSKALLVSADLLWWGSDRIEAIREQLYNRYGLRPECVILNATHSHSGPQTSFNFHRLVGTADQAYVENLEALLYTAVEEAHHNMESVTIERGLGVCYNGIQRRKYVNGSVMGGPNPDGPIDHDLNVVRFAEESGRTKAVISHYACHPVLTTANEVSSEFTGFAMERLERELEGAVCLFMQGCCADINIFKESAPDSMDDHQLIAYFGDKLAEAVLATLQAPMKLLQPAALSGTQVQVPLQLRPLASREELKAIVDDGKSPYDEWATEMLSRFEARDKTLTMEFIRLDVAEGLALLAMNAEVVVEYGLYLKSLSADLLPVAYSNGMIGYVPMAYQLRHNGYEADESTYYFHMPAKLEPEIEAPVKLALERLATTQSKEEA
ncbi:MAG: hypothetical protein K0R67_842 [Paenibacillus sp.]|jgi:hypothetical protein|nr:hypothetical protein [Paenibacillus sp.]